MTSPGQPSPSGAVTGLSAFAAKTEEDWRDEQRNEILPHFTTINDFGTLIRVLGNALVQAFGGNFTPLIELMDSLSADPPDWIDAEGWVAAVFATVADVVGEVASIISGEEDADSGDLSSWVNAVLGRDISLAGRVARLEGKIALGAEFFDDFNRGDNDSALGNGWIQGGAGQPLGIHDQAAQIRRDALPAEGVRWALCPQLATTDDFTIAAVIHPAGVSDYAPTVLYARCDTGFTTGICARFRRNATYIARFSRSGSTFTYTDITSVGTKFYSNSATVQFKGQGTTLQVLIDNVLVHTTTDDVHQLGPSYRSTGFSIRCETAILAIPQYGGGLASFAMRSTVDLEAVAQAQTTADAAQDTGVDNASAIDEINRKLDAAESGGGEVVTFNEPFNGSGQGMAGLNSADWEVVDPGGYTPSFYVTSGQIFPSGWPTGNAWVKHKAATSGDDFDISIVIGANMRGDLYDTGILFRANSDFTNFGYLNFYSDRLYLGWGTRSGAAWTPHDWISKTGTLTTGKTLRVTGNGNVYNVYLNGALFTAYADSSNTKATGAAYRYNGLRLRSYESASHSEYASPAVANFSVTSLVTLPYLGTGWHLYRNTTSQTAGSVGTSTDGVAVPAGTFNVPLANPNVTISDLGTGLVVVSKSGWYVITLQINFAVNTDGTISLFKGTSAGSLGVIRRAPTGDLSRVGMTWVVYCNAGDYLRPAILLGSGTATVIGDPAGSRTYFSGALM